MGKNIVNRSEFLKMYVRGAALKLKQLAESYIIKFYKLFFSCQNLKKNGFIYFVLKFLQTKDYFEHNVVLF